MFTHQDFDDHESVVYFADKKTGLKAIVAIHNTHLGPALGGCRIYDYTSEQAALTDALRLSKSMTYKSALAGLNLGGGKSVIIADPRTEKTAELLEAFAKQLNRLNGTYIAAEDSGTSVQDLLQMKTVSTHIAGVEKRLGIDGQPSHGDPSLATAYGVYVGMKAAANYKLNSQSMRGLKVAIQGVGNVGFHLAKYLREAGAELFVTDIYQQQVDRAVQDLGAKAVPTNEIHQLDVDVFAPCAMGAIINDVTLPDIKAAIIAGSANNQLLEASHGEVLREKGILYAPDYVINAGGIIDIYHEREGYCPDRSKTHIERITETLAEIFERADKEKVSTEIIADRLVEECLLTD